MTELDQARERRAATKKGNLWDELFHVVAALKDTERHFLLAAQLVEDSTSIEVECLETWAEDCRERTKNCIGMLDSLGAEIGRKHPFSS